MEKYSSKSAKDTKKLAQDLVYKYQNKNRNTALVFALSGKLGAGKTQFVQGAAKALNIQRNITSPTFVLMKKYKLNGGFMYHIDCYRLQSSEELLELQWADIIKNNKNIIFVEWGEKVKDIMPNGTIWVAINDVGEHKREIEL